MDLDALVRALADERPTFHTLGTGSAVSFAPRPELLAYLAEVVTRDSVTLETGAGSSTVVFLAAGARHTAVTPATDELGRIRSWCGSNGVPTDRLVHHAGPSVDVLPALAQEPLDVVLVDGDHAFPAPAIDWYYAARRLVAGGVVVLDDLQLWPCGIVAEFLADEDGWDLVREGPQFAAFRAGADGRTLTSRWWGQQGHVTRTLQRPPVWRRVARRVRRVPSTLTRRDG